MRTTIYLELFYLTTGVVSVYIWRKCMAMLTPYLGSPRHTRPRDRPAGTTQRQELHDLDITMDSHLGRPQPIRRLISSTEYASSALSHGPSPERHLRRRATR